MSINNGQRLVMYNKYKIITVTVCWTSFFIWEYAVRRWFAVSDTAELVRVDLIVVLPALIMLTLWAFLKETASK